MVVFENTVSGQHVVIARYEFRSTNYFLPLFLKTLSALKLRYIEFAVYCAQSPKFFFNH